MAVVLPGFRPVKHLNGAPYNGQFNRYCVPASDATAINVGDVVVLNTNAAVTSSGPGVYPAVSRATAGSPVAVGVVVGFEPNYANLNEGNVRQASTFRIVHVMDNSDVILAAPQDAVGGVVAPGSVGLNIQLAVNAAQTVQPFASQMSLDSSTVATTNTFPFQIVGITDAPDQDSASTARPAELLVRFNVHQYHVATGTAGV